MKYNNEVNYILVLGQAGVGKTTFVNTIIKSNIFKTSDDGPDMCTRECQIGRLTLENKHYSFIDTPGFDGPRSESEIEINKVISETPNIKCFILLFNIHEGRMDQSTAKLLEKLIKRFPIKNFWEHIIVVRTHVDEECRYGKRDRKENKNILLDFVNNYTIDEYYFGKSDEGGIVEDYEYNSTEFKKILNKINNLSSLN
jgi:GTPase Era involved in 16S rRNA processing